MEAIFDDKECAANSTGSLGRYTLNRSSNEAHHFQVGRCGVSVLFLHDSLGVLSHAVCTLSKTALARRYLAMMSSALAVQTKGLGLLVVMVNISLDRSYQISDRLKDPASNLLVGQIAKPTLDHVEPGAGSRHKVHMESADGV